MHDETVFFSKRTDPQGSIEIYFLRVREQIAQGLIDSFS
jgi:hypothetical protein